MEVIYYQIKAKDKSLKKKKKGINNKNIGPGSRLWISTKPLYGIMLSVYQNFHFIDFIEGGSLLKWSIFQSSIHMEYQYTLSFINFHFLLYLLTLVTFNVGGRRQRNKDLLRLDFRKLFHFFYSEMSMMPTVNRMDDLITTVRKCWIISR